MSAECWQLDAALEEEQDEAEWLRTTAAMAEATACSHELKSTAASSGGDACKEIKVAPLASQERCKQHSSLKNPMQVRKQIKMVETQIAALSANGAVEGEEEENLRAIKHELKELQLLQQSMLENRGK